MIYCTQCGKQLDNSAKFCCVCGTPIKLGNYIEQSINENIFYKMKERAIHYYNVGDYSQAYEYCQNVLDNTDDELMQELKQDILFAQSNEVLKYADNLLDNNPYDKISDEVFHLLSKAECIFPNNTNIEIIRDKMKNIVVDKCSKLVFQYMQDKNYKEANELVDDLKKAFPDNSSADSLYIVVKRNSPRKYR